MERRQKETQYLVLGEGQVRHRRHVWLRVYQGLGRPEGRQESDLHRGNYPHIFRILPQASLRNLRQAPIVPVPSEGNESVGIPD